MPHSSTVTAQPSPGVAHLPGLSGRSVRNLRHVRLVRSVRTSVAAAMAATAIAVGVGVMVPAYAQTTQPVVTVPLQAFSGVATATLPTVERDSYTATAPPPLQWPVARYTSITDGYGPRTAPCAGCSSFHAGVDITAGYGAVVRSIAAGVVVETSSPFNTSLGVHVTIQHVIDGQIVTSLYGHMQYGSMPFQVGDTVYSGQQIGLVGSTGASTGAHLHLEIRPGGTTTVNPMTWMYARLG